MTFILVPKRGDDLQINGWNWRPTLELLLRDGLISEELHERMGAQGAGGEADAELAGRIADAIERTLGEMKPGERMQADLTITDRPRAKSAITPETQPGGLDTDDIYSATREWLTTFAQFCRGSGGFEVF